MRVAYADPPYPRLASYYEEHPDYGGEVDHAALVEQLEGFDGWVLHTYTNALAEVLALCPPDTRVMAWVKTFASFKPNVYPAYAWEPVLLRQCRTPRRPSASPLVTGRVVMRDWIACPMTLQRGLTGAKPAAVARWAFEALGMEPDDELVDLFPGTGAISRAWEAWRAQPRLEPAPVIETVPLFDGTD